MSEDLGRYVGGRPLRQKYEKGRVALFLYFKQRAEDENPVRQISVADLDARSAPGG